jgi:tetratricopeptide (TPR) repeat protein
MYGYSKKRPTKEPDAFQKAVSEPVRRISGLGMTLAFGLLALLAVVAVLWVVAGRSEQKENEAWRQYDESLKERDPEARAKRLEKLAAETAGTGVRPLALLEAGVLYQEGALEQPPDKKLQRAEDLRKAVAVLEKFLAESPGHRLAVPARERLALVLEDSGQYEKALQAFRAAAEKAAGSEWSFMNGKLLYGEARCKEKLGDKAGALELLERAVTREGGEQGGAWLVAARNLLGSLREPAKKDLRIPGAVRDVPPEPEKPAGKETTKETSKEPSEETPKEAPAKGSKGEPGKEGSGPAAPAEGKGTKETSETKEAGGA